MQIIDACRSEVQAVGVSPDGRYLAAAAVGEFLVFNWGTGQPVLRTSDAGRCEQIAFYTPKEWIIHSVHGHALRLDSLDLSVAPPLDLAGEFAGGVAVSPDGRTLIATHTGEPNQVNLARWSLPGLRLQSGFDYWSPFRKLAFSPNGEFIAGIWPGVRHRWQPIPAEFELRFAHSGGVDYRYRPRDRRAFAAAGFISFTRDSELCTFGWEDEFRVLDISTGTNTSREPRRVEASFRDAAFTGSGHLFATVDDTGVLTLWDVKTWQVLHEYDWGCGPLSCVAFTADGSAGVCGTRDGRLVQFDVDE